MRPAHPHQALMAILLRGELYCELKQIARESS